MSPYACLSNPVLRFAIEDLERQIDAPTRSQSRFLAAGTLIWWLSPWWGDQDAGLGDRSLGRSIHLRRLIEEALVDAYGEDEQHGAFLVMFEDRVKCPFTALVVGEEVEVHGFDWPGAPHEIVALCRRKGRTHRVNVTALQGAGKRRTGAAWFEAYRAWLKGAW